MPEMAKQMYSQLQEELTGERERRRKAETDLAESLQIVNSVQEVQKAMEQVQSVIAKRDERIARLNRRSFQPLYLCFKFVDDSGLNVGKFHFVEQTSVFKLELLTLRFESCDLCFQIVHAGGQAMQELLLDGMLAVFNESLPAFVGESIREVRFWKK